MKKLLYALAAVMAVFIITNPSASAFKEHLGRTSYNGLVRERNYILFSTYEDKYSHVRYRALLENFFEEPEVVQPVVDSATKDPFAEFGGHAVSATK